MRKFLFIFYTLTALLACSSSDDDNSEADLPRIPGAPTEARGPFDRTVLVYISGENNLNSYIAEELQEIREGSKGIGDRNALLVYVDDANARHIPYTLWIKDGVAIDSMTLESDPISSSPSVIGRILRHASTYYPAKEYGMVLWGHGSGWMIEDSVAVSADAASRPLKAYGVDNGHNTTSYYGKWINMPTLAKTISEWGHMKFLFADCCQFQCIESAFELRNATDYIIGSPTEIPGKGAPYQTLTKGLFDSSETFYRTIVDAYFAQVIPISYGMDDWSTFQYNSRTPLSVIKTSELNELAIATNAVLHQFLPLANSIYPTLLRDSLIYYMGNKSYSRESVMYDMNDFIQKYTTRKNNTAADSMAYNTWKEAFDRAVVYRANAKEGWMTANQIQPYVFGYGSNGTKNTPILTDKRFGGVSMFIPQERKGSWYESYTKGGVSLPGYNASIKTTSWYYAARLSDFGW
jgi:hypothetical protein